MSLVDRVWRSITEPVGPPPKRGEPHLVQIVQYDSWVYPLVLDGSVTRVQPHGGVPVGEMSARSREVFQMERKTA
jgi:hypothetical protein